MRTLTEESKCNNETACAAHLGFLVHMRIPVQWSCDVEQQKSVMLVAVLVHGAARHTQALEMKSALWAGPFVCPIFMDMHVHMYEGAYSSKAL